MRLKQQICPNDRYITQKGVNKTVIESNYRDLQCNAGKLLTS